VCGAFLLLQCRAQYAERQDLQRLDLGLVTAPDRGERLELGCDFIALEIVDPSFSSLSGT
jgi:hypothetical protein